MATVVRQSDRTQQAVLMVDDEGYLLVSGATSGSGGGASQADLTACRSAREQLERDLKKAQSDLKQANDALNALNANVQQMIKEQEQELGTLRTKEQELRDLLKRQAAGASGLEGRITTLSDEISALRRRIKELEDQIKAKAGEVRTIVIEKPVWTLNGDAYNVYKRLLAMGTSLPGDGNSVLLAFQQDRGSNPVKPVYLGGNRELVSSWEEFYPRPGYAYPSPAWDVTGETATKLAGKVWALTSAPFIPTTEVPGVVMSLGFDGSPGPKNTTFLPNQENPAVIESPTLNEPTYPSNDGSRKGKVVSPTIHGGPPVDIIIILFEVTA